jgi:hypothetical protein
MMPQLPQLTDTHTALGFWVESAMKAEQVAASLQARVRELEGKIAELEGSPGKDNPDGADGDGSG